MTFVLNKKLTWWFILLALFISFFVYDHTQFEKKMSMGTGASNYDLFVKQRIDEIQYSSSTPHIWYQDFGVVESGPYKGWKRVIGFREEFDPTGGQSYLFVTQDGKTFITDSELYASNRSLYSGGDDTLFNTIAVVGTTTLPINNPFPETIKKGSIVLERQSFVEKKEFLEYATSSILFTEGEFTFYTQKSSLPEMSITATDNLIIGTSDLYAKDKSGVVMLYRTVSLPSYEEGELQKKKGEQYVFNYFNFKTKTDFLLNNGGSLGYEEYDNYFSFGCGYGGAIVHPKIQTDLSLIGATKEGDQLFILKDSSHPLLSFFYGGKMSSAYNNMVDGNKGYLLYTDESAARSVFTLPAPSFEEYVKKSPVVVMKDGFGRYILLSEKYYSVTDGCGKPVIYLYPEKKMNVAIRFLKKLYLGTDIPKYSSGWNVEADTDGRLRDLQRDKTDCNTLDVHKRGSEYAKDACEKNLYPYIYWAGRAEGIYPQPKTGFVVARDELKKELNEKLEQLSLNEKERDDMLEYWVKELEDAHTPYYRISFIQTQEMNKFIPMDVTPKPDTTIRIFLDWEPLQEKVAISHQELKSTQRKGFTLVEWGGLHR